MLYITALEAYNPIINCIKASAILLLSEIMLIRIHCHRYQMMQCTSGTVGLPRTNRQQGLCKVKQQYNYYRFRFY